MKRPWGAWLLYALCLAIALPALGWLSRAALDLERAELAAREAGQRDAQLRLAAWRIDMMLMPIVGPEAARSHDDFARLLTMPPAARYVLAYFELAPAAQTISPLAPDADGSLAALRAALDYRKLLAELPDEWLPETPSTDATVDLLDRAAGNQQAAQSAQTGKEFRKRQESNFKNIGRELAQQRLGKAAPPLREGVSRPLWIGDQLLLARRVQLGGVEFVEGAWFDWPALRAAIQSEAADLLPDLELRPITTNAAVNDSHALATLPVHLVAPAGAPTDPGWSPLRIALAVAWFGLAAGALAGGLLLAGMLALGERRAAFVSAVTHELRTPLTTFRMYAEMLGSGMVADEAQRQDYLRTLKIEADRLWRLVENVLAYARIERGRPTHHFQRLTLAELWQRVEPRLLERAQGADMQLMLDATQTSRTSAVVADPDAVEQILFNLVDNACKYAASATPRTIGVQLAAVNGHVELRVRDQGAGIAPADARKLFRPFSKSAERAAASAPGIGLGLALSRQLARQMRGDLRYEPSPAGTTFVLILPGV